MSGEMILIWKGADNVSDQQGGTCQKFTEAHLQRPEAHVLPAWGQVCAS